jgi:tetratricopeptide (TPR) repeat protein
LSVQVARQAVLDSPRSGAAWGNLAGTFLANELDDEALTCAAVAERLDPLNPRWPYYQGGVHLNRGDREGAVKHFRRAADCAASVKEGNDAPLLLLAETLLALGRLDEAEAELQRARGRRPDDVRVHFDLGLLAVAREDGNTARDFFRQCLDSPFTREKARRQLAAVSLDLGDLAAARQFRVEADLLPKDTEWDDPLVREYLGKSAKKRTHYRLAEQLEAQGQFLEAAELIRPLTEEDPNDDLAWLTLGKLLAQSSRPWLAEAALRRAVHLAPDKIQAHQYLGAHLLNDGEAALRQGAKEPAQKRFEEAAKCARQALARKPDYGAAHLTLGLALQRLGQNEEALAALRRAAFCNPEHGEVHLRLGEALARAGQTAEARTQLERALQLAPPGSGWAQVAKDRLAGLAKEP